MLLKTNEFNQITIQEICSYAKVVRKTFYNNFSSKEAVIEYMIDCLIEEYVLSLKSVLINDPKRMGYVYFDFWIHHQEFLSVIVNNNLFYLMQRKYYQYLPMVADLLKENKLDKAKKSSIHYVYTFYSSGLTSILEQWIQSGFQKSVSEMSEIFDLIAKGI
jgi:AcrR family transcriptional regulator